MTPGLTASADVVSEQVAPIVVSGLAAQGTVHANVPSCAVPTGAPAEPALARSVIRIAALGLQLAGVVAQVALAAHVGDVHRRATSASSAGVPGSPSMAS